MPFFEVEVEGKVREVYLVKAATEEDALKVWSDGEMLSQDTWDYEATKAVLDFQQDDEVAEYDGWETDWAVP